MLQHLRKQRNLICSLFAVYFNFFLFIGHCLDIIGLMFLSLCVGFFFYIFKRRTPGGTVLALVTLFISFLSDAVITQSSWECQKMTLTKISVGQKGQFGPHVLITIRP